MRQHLKLVDDSDTDSIQINVLESRGLSGKEYLTNQSINDLKNIADLGVEAKNF